MGRISIFLQKNVSAFKICALAMILIVLTPLGHAKAQSDWAATLYVGQLTDARLGEIFTGHFKFEDAYFAGLGLTRRIYSYRQYLDLELGGQVNKFFGDQDNWEFDFLGYIRWLPFPWDKSLDTSFAAGAGLSYATSVPQIEVKNQGKSAQFLGMLSFEFAFALPRIPQWSLVAGIYHRSGAGGTFSGVKSASNGFDVGIRYSF